MYLSSLQLSIGNPAVRQCLKDCQDMHRTLMKAFPQVEQGQPRETSGVLYRIVYNKSNIRVYVLSRVEPHWQVIADQGFKNEGVKSVSKLLNVFIEGRRFAFDALLCPTKKVPNPQGNSKRAFLQTADERLLWLHRKAEQSGFILEWVREDGHSKARSTPRQSQRHQMWHTGVKFRGVLVVTDREAFTRAFCSGIGAGKAYGFGLLMLFKEA